MRDPVTGDVTDTLLPVFPVGLTKREQAFIVGGQIAKDGLRNLDSSAKILFVTEEPGGMVSRIQSRNSYQNKRFLKALTELSAPLDLEIDDVFNNTDIVTLFDNGLMRFLELNDLLSIILWNIKGLEVFRPDGTKVPLILPEEFDDTIILPEYVITRIDSDGLVAVAIIPTSENYLFNIVPSSSGFQMNVTGGESTGEFIKYEREAKDPSLIWNSQDDTLGIDTTGDGFVDLKVSPELIDFEDVEVGPEGEEEFPGETEPPAGKRFTFNCEHSMKRGPFLGLEKLTLEVGDTENCTLKLTNHKPGKTVEISSLLRRGFRSAIKIEPERGVTDANGEVEITITAVRKGKDWAAWAVKNDKGQFKFNKKSYDSGHAWGLFVKVK